MADKTKIEWVDHSASPWHGCAEVHKGCDNCYARTMAKRNPGTLGVWGPDGTRVKSASFHANCRRWNEQAKRSGKRATVFPSICDPFEDWQGKINDSHGFNWIVWDDGKRAVTPADRDPEAGDEYRWLTMDDLRRELFATIDACPWLDFILLTKRPENVRRMWPATPGIRKITSDGFGPLAAVLTIPETYRPNVWLLTSVSDQATADTFHPHITDLCDLVDALGFSAEPLLGPIVMPKEAWHRLQWCIIGGESGHGARPMHPNWARSLRDQCQAAGVPFFFKQWGEFAPLSNHHVKVPSGNYAFTPSGEKVTVHDKRDLRIWPATEIDDNDCFSAVRVGKEAAGRLLDGREWNEYPTTKASVAT